MKWLILVLAMLLSACDDAGYVASDLRKPFHKPSCEWAEKIDWSNLETFETREDAIADGHRPCRWCRP